LLLIWWGSLLLVLRLARLRITRLSGLRIGWLCLLLVRWWWWRRLADNWGLGEGGRRECGQKCSTKDAGVEFVHGLFLWAREQPISFTGGFFFSRRRNFPALD
jgi:hypothetical protein